MKLLQQHSHHSEDCKKHVREAFKKKTAYFRNCSEKGGEGSTQTQT